MSWLETTLEEIAQLARDMIRLEEWAKRAERHEQWAQAGTYWAERDEVRDHRSRLLRQLWATAKARRRRASPDTTGRA